jgi:hypothetical protein
MITVGDRKDPGESNLIQESCGCYRPHSQITKHTSSLLKAVRFKINHTVLATSVSSRTASSPWIHRSYRCLGWVMQLTIQGRLRAAVHAGLALIDTGHAHRVLLSRENHGKVILRS